MLTAKSLVNKPLNASKSASSTSRDPSKYRTTGSGAASGHSFFACLSATLNFPAFQCSFTVPAERSSALQAAPLDERLVPLEERLAESASVLEVVLPRGEGSLTSDADSVLLVSRTVDASKDGIVDLVPKTGDASNDASRKRLFGPTEAFSCTSCFRCTLGPSTAAGYTDLCNAQVYCIIALLLSFSLPMLSTQPAALCKSAGGPLCTGA